MFARFTRGLAAAVACTVASTVAFAATLTVASASANAAPGAGGCSRQISVSSLAKPEGTAGGGTSAHTDFVFWVSTKVVAAPTATSCRLAPLTVHVATSTGSAGPSDFAPVSTSLTWSAGDSATRKVTVQVVADALFEATESFTVKLTSVSGLRLTIATGTGSIVNDDVPPPCIGWHCSG